MKQNYILFLEDIYNRIEKINKYIEGMCFEDFKTDDKYTTTILKSFIKYSEVKMNIDKTFSNPKVVFGYNRVIKF